MTRILKQYFEGSDNQATILTNRDTQGKSKRSSLFFTAQLKELHVLLCLYDTIATKRNDPM